MDDGTRALPDDQDVTAEGWQSAPSPKWVAKALAFGAMLLTAGWAFQGLVG